MTAQERMTAHGIKPSALRLHIYDYLDSHRTHPTVDEIYSDLVATYPTLSKTTVYNTVNLFAGHGLVKAIAIEGFRTRFDANAAFHGHFLCRRCGKIYDVFSIDCPPFPESGFQVEAQDVYYSGCCKSCLDNNNH